MSYFSHMSRTRLELFSDDGIEQSSQQIVRPSCITAPPQVKTARRVQSCCKVVVNSTANRIERPFYQQDSDGVDAKWQNQNYGKHIVTELKTPPFSPEAVAE